MILRALFRISPPMLPRGISSALPKRYTPPRCHTFHTPTSKLSRAFSQAHLRNLPRPISRTFPRPASSPTYQRISLQSQRFASNFRPPNRPGKIIHTKFDPEQIRHAKPLITVEQIRHVAFHSTTKVIVVVAGVGAVIFYVSNLEEVPVSGRRRFNCYSDASVEAQGDMMYEMIMRDQRANILPDWDPRVKKVRGVMERLIPASGLEDTKWELHVIESPEMNAFVLPGGKVFVFSGILPIAKDDDGIAAILGHEISHQLARHTAEQMSSMVILAPIRWAFIYLDYSGITYGLGRILGDIALQLGLMMPASRKQESEADYLGLLMMSKACYDPTAAVKVWERMEAAAQADIPQWLSTHPSNNTRIEQMQKWLPKAEAAREESECSVTLGYAKEFQEAMTGWRGFGRML